MRDPQSHDSERDELHWRKPSEKPLQEQEENNRFLLKFMKIAIHNTKAEAQIYSYVIVDIQSSRDEQYVLLAITKQFSPILISYSVLNEAPEKGFSFFLSLGMSSREGICMVIISISAKAFCA